MNDPRAAHRELRLTSPLMEGPDVKALQEAMSQELKHRKLDFAKPEIDGDFGRETLGSARLLAFAIGLSDDRMRVIRNQHRLTEKVQRLLRNPEDRSDGDRERERKRKPEIRRKRERARSGPKRAVEWARDQVGTTEQPAGSNLGPGITGWQQFTGYAVPSGSPPRGVFWCGCLVCNAVVKIGRADIPDRIRLGFAPHITEDARNGRNGFLKAVPPEEARAGDIVTFFGGEHIALCVGPSSGGQVHTIDGNTSSTMAGSQTNGGGVFEKRRSFGDVDAVGRIDW